MSSLAMCAKCNKQVYPVERLDVLNRVWHKGCFNCEVCGIKLTMKTYVALDKIPYCKAHYPKQQATTVTDTPEMLRLQQNTKMQSNVAYTAEFQKQVHEYTVVSDQPEISRAINNMKIISNAQYHNLVSTPTTKTYDIKDVVSVDGESYEASFDYNPGDDDEVPFKKGDIILNAINVSDGWLQGTNDRTGKSGFLPEPYLKRIHVPAKKV